MRGMYCICCYICLVAYKRYLSSLYITMQMERTVEIDDNHVSLKDLNDMLMGSWSDTDPAVVLGPIGGIHVGNVSQRLGLYLKDDSMGDKVILNGDIEEGEIIS